MKLALLFPPLAGLACLFLTGCATDLQRSAYQDAGKINKYSRRNMMAIAPTHREPRYYPVPYRYAAAPVAAPEHSYSTESVYNEPGYRPASTYGPYVATDVGGFGGRAYRYQTGSSYAYGSPYVDPYYGGGYYGGYYPASTVVVTNRGGNFHGRYGGGGVRFAGGGFRGRR